MIALEILALAAATSGAPVQTQEQPAPPPPTMAVRPDVAIAREAQTPPVIDGRADDALWQTAPRIDAFREFQPDPDGDPRFRTEFQVGFDAHNLYVFVRAYDPYPDSIMRALTRRDQRGPSDQLKIIVDSYNDRRSGFEFAVNPDGVKRDYAVYNDNQEDQSWNGVWDVGTLVDEQGWTAEFRIPLSQLRFNEASSHTFGFGVWRDIERYAERVSWPVYSVTANGLASQLGQLEGLNGLGSPARLELTPYTVTKNVSRPTSSGFGREQQFAMGADLKYGITPNITLDATVNPDFGQVEADPAVLNLSAFETFLAERRPFFVEGTGLYQFSLNCYIVVDCSTNEGLFYSRRIGRAPTLLGVYGDASTSTATPIAAAAKLTGRTASGFSFGVLDAATQHVDGANNTTVEPRTNYAVLRAQQDLREGETSIGIIATAVNRNLDDWTSSVLHRNAYVGGANFRNRFGNGNYEFAASIAASRVDGTPDAIARTQRSAVHYFQQPDDDHELDPTRTSLGGHALQVKFGKYGGGITRFETSLVRQSAGFEPNDLGFLRRADILDWSTWAALSFRTPTKLYRWAQVNGNHWEHWTTSGLRLENAFNFNGHLGLHNNWDIHAGGTVNNLGDSHCDRCTRGGPALRDSPGIFPWFGINLDSRKAIVPSMWVNLGFYHEGKSRDVSLSPSLTLNLSTRLRASLGAGINQIDNDMQWYENVVDDNTGDTDFVFAHLDQRTLSLNVRLNYTATPDLTLEFYGQPFVSTGTYSNFREVSATPRADDYENRFVPYGTPGQTESFRFSQLRTNTVLRWEYRPGSTLFLVWAHGRQAFVDNPLETSWRDDYQDLFDLHPDNTFLIKVAYWLNR